MFPGLWCPRVVSMSLWTDGCWCWRVHWSWRISDSNENKNSANLYDLIDRDCSSFRVGLFVFF